MLVPVRIHRGGLPDRWVTEKGVRWRWCHFIPWQASFPASFIPGCSFGRGMLGIASGTSFFSVHCLHPPEHHPGWEAPGELAVPTHDLTTFSGLPLQR